MNETFDALIEQLHHPDRNRRGRAALSLGELCDVRAVDALVPALCTEADPFVRENITWALVRTGDAALRPLLDLLRDADPLVRHHAAHVLGKIGDPRASDALIDALQDHDATVLAKAAFALGRIGDARAITALVGLLGHDSRELQSTLVTVLEGFGPPAVPALLDALQHERWQVREQAAYILGALASAAARPALMKALEDREWQVRFAALHALATLGGAGSLHAVQSMLGDGDRRVRSLATDVMKRMSP
jgi:HEAT repeat protein